MSEFELLSFTSVDALCNVAHVQAWWSAWDNQILCSILTALLLSFVNNMCAHFLCQFYTLSQKTYDCIFIHNFYKWCLIFKIFYCFILREILIWNKTRAVFPPHHKRFTPLACKTKNFKFNYFWLQLLQTTFWNETSVIISPELWLQTAQIYEPGSLQNLGKHAAICLGFCSTFHGENDGETILLSRPTFVKVMSEHKAACLGRPT